MFARLDSTARKGDLPGMSVQMRRTLREHKMKPVLAHDHRQQYGGRLRVRDDIRVERHANPGLPVEKVVVLPTLKCMNRQDGARPLHEATCGGRDAIRREDIPVDHPVSVGWGTSKRKPDARRNTCPSVSSKRAARSSARLRVSRAQSSPRTRM